MSTPPELPPGDDPFELLGVEPGDDRKTIKRAYTRLIRVYKPEKYPAEFQRIRAAYEALRDGAPKPSADGEAPPGDPLSADEFIAGLHERLRVDFPDVDFSGAEFPNPADASTDDADESTWEMQSDAAAEWQEDSGAVAPADDPWRADDVWQAASAGDIERARALLRTRSAERAPHAADFAHGFLLGEFDGDNEAAAEWLEEGLASGAAVATWARQTLDPDTLNRLSVRDGFAWAILRAQPDREAAAALYHFRSDELLMRGRLDTVVDEVSDREFRREALEDDKLRLVPVSVASALIWEDLDRGLELFDTFAAEVGRNDDSTFEDMFLHVRRAAEAWHAWDGRDKAPDAYRRFVQLRAVVDPGQQRRLARALHGDFLDRPTEYAGFLEELAKSGDALVSFHVYALWEGDLVDDDGDFALPEPGDAAVAAMGEAAAAIERELDRASANKVSSFVLLMHLVLIVLGFLALGWWGVLTMVALVVTGLRSISWFDERLYRKSIRPTLVRLIAEHEVHASHILRNIAGTKGVFDEVARFTSEIGEDTSLHHVYLMSRLRRFT